MALLKPLSPDFVYPDERGVLTQLCHAGYAQVNAVFTRAGAKRGNFHYHENTKEAFFILSGRVRVRAYLGDESETREYGTGDMFLVEENVRHSFDYLEDTYLVGLYTRCVENPDGTKDIHCG